MFKRFILFLLYPLGVGALSALLSSSGMAQYAALTAPPLAPPGIVFPIVWTILFILMGISSYLVYETGKGEDALSLYNLQLLVNFAWSILFFTFEWRLFSFFWILLLIVLVCLMIRRFYAISPAAAYLQIPYLVWLCFAAYLNLGYYLLNR